MALSQELIRFGINCPSHTYGLYGLCFAGAGVGEGSSGVDLRGWQIPQLSRYLESVAWRRGVHNYLGRLCLPTPYFENAMNFIYAE